GGGGGGWGDGGGRRGGGGGAGSWRGLRGDRVGSAATARPPVRRLRLRQAPRARGARPLARPRGGDRRPRDPRRGRWRTVVVTHDTTGLLFPLVCRLSSAVRNGGFQWTPLRCAPCRRRSRSATRATRSPPTSP